MLTIRRARINDLDRIYEITAAAFGPYCMAKLLEDRFGIVDGKPWHEHKGGSVVASCRENIERLIVAEEDEKVVGYASFQYRGSWGMVGNNAVDPAYQGRGIGTRLIRAVLGRLRAAGATELHVTTMEHDTPARRIYEKLGFQLTDVVLQFAKQAGDSIDRHTVPASDAEACESCRREGFIEMARSVRYQME